MINAEEKLVNDLLLKLSKYVNREELEGVKCAVVPEVHKYNLEEKSTELALTNDNGTAKAIKLFLTSKLIEGKSEKTIRKYKFDLDKFFEYVPKEFSEVSTNDIRDFLGNYQHNRGKKVSNTTMDNIRKTLSSFYGWLEKEGYISKNPMKKVSNIKHDTIKETPYTFGEMEAMMLAADCIRDKCILEFLYATGCRVSELCDLNIEDIDLITKVCQIYHGKGDKHRTVPLDDKCIFYLKEYLKWRTFDTTNALFVQMKEPHNRITPSGVRSIIKNVSQKANVIHAHPHRYRVTRITILLMRGMKLEEVQAISGHEDITMVAHYNRVNLENVYSSFRKIA